MTPSGRPSPSSPATLTFAFAGVFCFLERYTKEDAQKLFQEALAIQPKHAGATYATALLAADGFEQQAVDFAQRALEVDPKMLEAQELLAKLALEDNNEPRAHRTSGEGSQDFPGSPRCDGRRLTIDLLHDKKTASGMDASRPSILSTGTPGSSRVTFWF